MGFSGMTLPGIENLRQQWGWLLGLGVTLFVLGLLAATSAFAATLTTVIFLAVLLLIGGAVEISNAFRHGRYGGFWMHLFTGVLDIVCGSLLLAFPASGAAAVTLVLAIFFLVGGSVRAFSGLMMKLPNGGWAIASGIVDALIGLMLIASWPVSALWFLGLCVGIGLIFRGIWWVAFAIAVRNAPEGDAPAVQEPTA